MKFAEIWLTGLTWFLWILFAMFLISSMWGWAALYFVIASVACNIDPKSVGRSEKNVEEVIATTELQQRSGWEKSPVSYLN